MGFDIVACDRNVKQSLDPSGSSEAPSDQHSVHYKLPYQLQTLASKKISARFHHKDCWGQFFVSSFSLMVQPFPTKDSWEIMSTSCMNHSLGLNYLPQRRPRAIHDLHGGPLSWASPCSMIISLIYPYLACVMLNGIFLKSFRGRGSYSGFFDVFFTLPCFESNTSDIFL